MAVHVTYYEKSGSGYVGAWRQIIAVYKTAAAATAAASAGGADIHAHGTGVADTTDVGNWLNKTTHAVQSAAPTPTAADRKKAVREEAVAHARLCLDLMKPGWMIGDGVGRFSVDGATGATRYRNTWYWIMHACTAVVFATTRTGWSAAQCEAALEAFKSLVPADEDRIRFWYLNHDQNIWAAYSASGASDTLRCWFKYERGAAKPEFATDASSSTLWDGSGHNSVKPAPGNYNTKGKNRQPEALLNVLTAF